MKPRDVADLLLLAALWGASFLFMRVAAPAFGPAALVEVRVLAGAIFLLPLLAARGSAGLLRAHAGRLALVGLLAAAAPFALITYAMLTLTAGFAAILNATVPMWTALIAALWLRDRSTPLQWLGLAIGAAGVVVLVGDQVDFRPGASQWRNTVAVGAALLGMAFYGLSANVAKTLMAGVPALVTATGSQIAAALLLAPAAALLWPAQPPAAGDWAAAVVLGVACTGIAYILYFRLIASVGAMRAANVTFLIPLFATVWGGLFLGETLTARMAAGGAIVLAGTALALGVLGRRAAPAGSP